MSREDWKKKWKKRHKCLKTHRHKHTHIYTNNQTIQYKVIYKIHQYKCLENDHIINTKNIISSSMGSNGRLWLNNFCGKWRKKKEEKMENIQQKNRLLIFSWIYHYTLFRRSMMLIIVSHHRFFFLWLESIEIMNDDGFNVPDFFFFPKKKNLIVLPSINLIWLIWLDDCHVIWIKNKSHVFQTKKKPFMIKNKIKFSYSLTIIMINHE